jgi:MFS family permease
MRSWLLRGFIFAFVMVVLRLVQGKMINTWETKAQPISIVLVAIFAIAALIWGFFDGRSDAKAQPDPDRRLDLAMTWLLGGLVAGVLSGAVAWLIALFYKDIYTGGLVSELTTFAAFTALLTFVMATVGVGIGRYLVDRRYNREHPVPTHERSTGPDTDVFAAVRDDGKTQEAPAR